MTPKEQKILRVVLAILLVLLLFFGFGLLDKALHPEQETEAETQQETIAWPENDYTAVIPEPEKLWVFSEDKNEAGYCLIVEWESIDDAKAYYRKLLDAGFTEEAAPVHMEFMYTANAENKEGWHVTVFYISKGSSYIAMSRK